MLCEIHTAEPLVPEPSAFEFELAIEKLKSHKSPGVDQIATDFIQTGGNTICGVIHKVIISVWDKEELPEEWKELIIVPTRSVNKVMRLIQYNAALTFKQQIKFVSFKIVPLGGYIPPETLFPLYVTTLVVANRNRF